VKEQRYELMDGLEPLDSKRLNIQHEDMEEKTLSLFYTKVLKVIEREKREQKLEASTNKKHQRREVTGKTNRYFVGVVEEGYNKHYEEWQRQR
jgi:hypothetical protein